MEGVVGFHDAIRKCKFSWPLTNIHPYSVMAMEPCSLSSTKLSSFPQSHTQQAIQGNYANKLWKGGEIGFHPHSSQLCHSPLTCALDLCDKKRKKKRLLKSVTKYLNYFFFFQFSGQCFICTYSLIKSLSLHVYSRVSCMCFILYRC